MKRYLVFRGDDYYPSGGFKDFKASYDTLEEAVESAKSSSGDWAHVVDVQHGEMVWGSSW